MYRPNGQIHSSVCNKVYDCIAHMFIVYFHPPIFHRPWILKLWWMFPFSWKVLYSHW